MRMCGASEDRSAARPRRHRARETAFRTPRAEADTEGGREVLAAVWPSHEFSAASEARI